jgi:hypothetical protein
VELIGVVVVWGVSRWRGGLAWLWGGLVRPRCSGKTLFSHGRPFVICSSCSLVWTFGHGVFLRSWYTSSGD